MLVVKEIQYIPETILLEKWVISQIFTDSFLSLSTFVFAPLVWVWNTTSSTSTAALNPLIVNCSVSSQLTARLSIFQPW